VWRHQVLSKAASWSLSVATHHFCRLHARNRWYPLYITHHIYDTSVYSVSQKNSPWNFLTFFPNGWEFLVQILHAYYTFLSTLDYKFFIQLSATLTKLCHHIKRDHHNVLKMSPSTETHAGWSHLIWHNFVTVGDNWIKLCTLAYVRTFNRRVKFGLTIPNYLGKMSKNASVRFDRWWTFCAHDLNWVVSGHA